LNCIFFKFFEKKKLVLNIITDIKNIGRGFLKKYITRVKDRKKKECYLEGGNSSNNRKVGKFLLSFSFFLEHHQHL
jgi:hypothetical protein